MATLADLVNRLPRTLAARFSKEIFWVQVANDVMSDIEKKVNLPRVIDEQCIALVPGQVDYLLPDVIRKVLGAYRPAADSALVDGRSRLDWMQRGRYVELRVDDSELTAVGPAFTQPILHPFLDHVEIDTAALVSTVDPTFKMAKLNNQADTRVVARVTEAAGVQSWWFKRPIVAAGTVDPPTSISIYEHFFVLEYIRGFARIDDPVDAIVDGEEAILQVLRAGMRYYGELQSDEEGELTKLAFQEYQNQMASFANWMNRGTFRPGKNFKTNFRATRGESWREPGNTSGIYGDPEAQG